LEVDFQNNIIYIVNVGKLNTNVTISLMVYVRSVP